VGARYLCVVGVDGRWKDDSWKERCCCGAVCSDGTTESLSTGQAGEQAGHRHRGHGTRDVHVVAVMPIRHTRLQNNHNMKTVLRQRKNSANASNHDRFDSRFLD